MREEYWHIISLVTHNNPDGQSCSASTLPSHLEWGKSGEGDGEGDGGDGDVVPLGDRQTDRQISLTTISVWPLTSHTAPLLTAGYQLAGPSPVISSQSWADRQQLPLTAELSCQSDLAELGAAH